MGVFGATAATAGEFAKKRLKAFLRRSLRSMGAALLYGRRCNVLQYGVIVLFHRNSWLLYERKRGPDRGPEELGGARTRGLWHRRASGSGSEPLRGQPEGARPRHDRHMIAALPRRFPTDFHGAASG